MGCNIGVAIEELTLCTTADGVESQQHFLQQFFGVQWFGFLFVVVVSVLNHVIQIGQDRKLSGFHDCEIRIVIQTPFGIESGQHQFNGINVHIREVFVSTEEILEERDVLRQSGALAKSRRSFRIILTIYIP